MAWKPTTALSRAGVAPKTRPGGEQTRRYHVMRRPAVRARLESWPAMVPS
jgi:hypothetical protein